MQFIQEANNLQGKTVLVRCDFNAPLENGKIADNFRLLSHLETIKYLQSQGCKIVLLSHLESRGNVFCLKFLSPILEKILKEKVVFLPLVLSKKTRKKISKAENRAIFLLDNLRKDKGEKQCSKDFASGLALLGDVFAQDAFSVCHRKHSSVVLLPKLLPSFSGLALQKEINFLNTAMQKPPRPLTAIIGGSKIDEKIKPLLALLKTADNVLIGGALISQILSVNGILVGRPWPKEETVKYIKNIYKTANLHMPLDVLVSSDAKGEGYIRKTAPGRVLQNEEIYDISEETIKKFGKIISLSKTILWVGDLGKTEIPAFRKGTQEIAEAISVNRTALKIAGGGDTINTIRDLGLEDGFSYLSTGGSALLDYLANGSLPGIDVL